MGRAAAGGEGGGGGAGEGRGGIISEKQLEATLKESGVRVLIRELQDAPELLGKCDIIEPIEEGCRFRVELAGLPANRTPVTTWSNPDEVWAQVAHRIGEAAREISERRG